MSESYKSNDFNINMEDKYSGLTDDLYVFSRMTTERELLYVLDTFCIRIFNNTKMYEFEDMNTPISNLFLEKTLEGFFEELNLSNEYLNNVHCPERNHFIGLDMLEIKIKNYIKELEGLLKSHKIDKEEYDYYISYANGVLENHANWIDEDNKVTATLTGTIEDIYRIAHENIHLIYQQSSGPLSNKYLLEVPTITAELLMRDYLEKRGVKEEGNKFIMWRLNDSRELMAWFHFEIILIKLYIELIKKHEKITDELVIEELLKEDEPLRSHLIKQKDFYIKTFHDPIELFRYIFWYNSCLQFKG